jgi:hypothetical protein
MSPQPFYFAVPDVSSTPIVCVGGGELISYYQRQGSQMVRGFCSRCGSRLFNVAFLGIGSHPSIFNTFPFDPAFHLEYRQRRLTVEEEEAHERLPKLMDVYREWGGSGQAAYRDAGSH